MYVRSSKIKHSNLVVFEPELQSRNFFILFSNLNYFQNLTILNIEKKIISLTKTIFAQ